MFRDILKRLILKVPRQMVAPATMMKSGTYLFPIYVSQDPKKKKKRTKKKSIINNYRALVILLQTQSYGHSI